MALKYDPLSRNLRSKVTVFLSLELEDLMLILMVAAIMGVVGSFMDRKLFGWLDLNLFLQYGIPILAIPSLLIFKYGKPRGYLKDRILYQIRPHIYSPGARDTQHANPYLKYDGED